LLILAIFFDLYFHFGSAIVFFLFFIIVIILIISRRPIRSLGEEESVVARVVFETDISAGFDEGFYAVEMCV
jgi:hypothetical protein